MLKLTWFANACLRVKREGSINSLSLLFLCHFVLVGTFIVLGPLNLFHVKLTLQILCNTRHFLILAWNVNGCG